MDERSLPPLVEGEQQGRLDMILARPSLFPPLHIDQTLVFTVRWWGDIKPCVVRLPPDKTETRYTFAVTCGAVSFRQYLYDAHSLRFSIEVLGGETVSDASKGSEDKKNSPKRGTPREVLMRRQARLKKGWQNGDVVGSFVVMELRLNARAEFLHEAKIVDEFGDIVGSIVMTLFFHEGTLEDFKVLRLYKEEQEAKEREKEEENKRRLSSLPRSKSSNLKEKQSTEVSLISRASIIKESSSDSPRRKISTKALAKLSTKKDIQDKENQSPLREKIDTPENVISSSKSDQMREDQFIRPRPASWTLCSLLDGVDPYELVESGALRAEDLPALLQVIEGKSPNIDMKNLNPETQKLLSRIDLSMSFSGMSFDFSGIGVYEDSEADVGNMGKRKKPGYSVMKGRSVDSTDTSGLSGLWPLEEKQAQNKSSIDNIDNHRQKDEILSDKRTSSAGKGMYDSPKRSSRPIRGSSHPPVVKSSGSNRRDAKGTVLDDASGMNDVHSNTSPLKDPVKEDESSVLVVDIETLSLVPPLLQRKPGIEDEKNVSAKHTRKGSHILQRSRTCYLTNLEVQTGTVLPADWECSNTCASRQVHDHEVRYNVRQVLKLPPVSSLEVLRSVLVIRCVNRRLGQKESEEIGRATVSVMDLWRLSGSRITVPLLKPHLGNLDPPGRSLLLADKTENIGEQPYITITARLGLAVGHASMHSFLKEDSVSHSYVSEMSDIDILSKKRFDTISEDKIGMKHSLSMSWGQQDSIEMTDDNIKLYEVRGNSNESVLGELEENEKPKIHRPQPRIHEIHKPLGSDVFNSMIITDKSVDNSTIFSDRSFVSNASGHVEVVDSFLGTPMETRVMVSSNERDNSSFLYTKSNHITPSREKQSPLFYDSNISSVSPSVHTPTGHSVQTPLGHSVQTPTGHSIQTPTANQWLGDVTSKYHESIRDMCTVHLEVIKGRNLPWVMVKQDEQKPPCSYVKTTIGGVNINTSICVEEDNPTWNFAADVDLPYSQLSESGGNLILKVYHSMGNDISEDDPLLGFVCVDATSIWSGHVSLCGWYPVLDLRGALRGHVKVSLTPHEPPTSFSSPHLSFLDRNFQSPTSSNFSSNQRSSYVTADSYPYRPQSSDGESRLFYGLESHEDIAYRKQINDGYRRQTDSPNSLNINSSARLYDKNTSYKEDSIASSIYSDSSLVSSQSVVIEPSTLNETSVNKHSSLPVSPRPEESLKRISTKRSGIPRSRSYSASSGKASYVKANNTHKVLVTSSSTNSCTNSFMQKPCNPLSRIGSYISASSAVVGQSCNSQSHSPRTAIRSTSFSQLSDRQSISSVQNDSHIPVISQQPHKTQNRTRSLSFTSSNTYRKVSPNSKKLNNGPTSRVLPNIAYQENYMNSVINQSNNKKDSFALKQISTNDSPRVGKYPYEINAKSELEKSQLPVRQGSILMKDSLIVSHFRMMDAEKDKDMDKNSNILSGIATPKVKSLLIKQESSSSSSYGSSDEKEENKPTSCLRTPGSPSMRTKKVKFADQLISGASTTARPASPFTKSPSVSTLSSYLSNSKDNIQKEHGDPHEQSTLLRTHYDRDDYNVNERSDLQVVPCREGDTQVVDIVSNSGQGRSGKSNTTKTLTNTTTAATELIMRYSWMNQMSGSDTPCQSFIETKVISKETEKSKPEPFFLHEDAEKDVGALESPDATGVSSLLQKTRRLRNRLAANFNIQ